MKLLLALFYLYVATATAFFLSLVKGVSTLFTIPLFIGSTALIILIFSAILNLYFTAFYKYMKKIYFVLIATLLISYIVCSMYVFYDFISFSYFIEVVFFFVFLVGTYFYIAVNHLIIEKQMNFKLNWKQILFRNETVERIQSEATRKAFEQLFKYALTAIIVLAIFMDEMSSYPVLVLMMNGVILLLSLKPFTVVLAQLQVKQTRSSQIIYCSIFVLSALGFYITKNNLFILLPIVIIMSLKLMFYKKIKMVLEHQVKEMG